MDNLTEHLNIRIEPSVKRQLESHAQRRRFKLAQLVRLILIEWLDNHRMAELYTTEADNDD